jgi:hypothetical protein
MAKRDDKKVLLEVGDGPESISIYTSDERGVVDWSPDLPALYLEATTQDTHVRLGPFQLSTIRKYFEEVAEIVAAKKLLDQVRIIHQQAEEDGIQL